MSFRDKLKRLIVGPSPAMRGVIAGIDNQSRLLNDRLREVVAAIDNQSRILSENLSALRNEWRQRIGPVQTRAENDDLDSLLDAVCARATTPAEAARVFDRVLRDLVARHHHSVFWGDRLLTLDKSAAFRDEPAFGAAMKSADSTTGANQYESPDGIAWRYNTLIWAARTCLKLPGDFVECGVFRGDMSWMITQNVDLQSAGKRFYLYDTFTGFDPNYSSADDFPYGADFVSHIDQDYKAPDIEDHVRRRFRDKSYVVVTKGTVPDILKQVAPDRIAFLHIDMNSPRAATGALEVLFDRVSPGGILVFDDYGWKQHRKEKDAADHFMTARSHVVLELPTGQGLAIKR